MVVEALANWVVDRELFTQLVPSCLDPKFNSTDVELPLMNSGVKVKYPLET